MFAIGHSNFLQALGWAVINSLWQMALLWVVYQLITAIFKNFRASRKSMLATTLLFTGFAWFLLTFLVTLQDAAATQKGYSAFITVAANENVNSWLFTFLPVASIIYLFLLTLPILNFIRNYRYVQVIRRQGLEKANVQWRIFVQNVAAHMGIKAPVHVWMSQLVSSPVTIGFLKPIILLPVAAVNHLDTRQVEAILLHELSHIRRFDFLLNLISKAIQTILYFNPFVKAFAKIIETEREKNCDEIVLQFQYEPHGYASALLTLEKAAHPMQTLAVAASTGEKKDLLTRVESILGIRRKPAFSFTRLAGILAALLCFIGINAVLLFGKAGDAKLKPGLLTDLSVPFHLFSPAHIKGIENAPADDEQSVLAESGIKSIVNTTQGKAVKIADKGTDIVHNSHRAVVTEAGQFAVSPPDPPDPLSPYRYVSSLQKLVPELAPEEVKQVQEALKVSQKIMEEDHWKSLEKNIADAMTSSEKEQLKADYKKELTKLDWAKIEDQLKLAYEEINWNQINLQLNNAMAEIKLDSLQNLYTSAIAELKTLETALKENKQQGIPDSGISLKTLSQQRTEAQQLVNKIKLIKNRKIVHL